MKIKPSYKSKRLNITIDFKDPLELKGALFHIVEQIKEGSQFNEANYIEKSTSYSYYLEYLDAGNFEEREIDGKLCIVFKSRINEID
jgi:hypothetical protein